MAFHYRVVDLRTDTIDPTEHTVAKAKSPEEAALVALGESLVRSGRRQDLRARVYFQNEGQPMTMVRLYRRVEDRA